MMDYHFLLLPLHPTLYLIYHIISCKTTIKITIMETIEFKIQFHVKNYLRIALIALFCLIYAPPHPGTIRERIG